MPPQLRPCSCFILASLYRTRIWPNAFCILSAPFCWRKAAEPSLDVDRFCEFQNLAEYLWYVWLRLWTSWDCRIDLVQCRIQWLCGPSARSFLRPGGLTQNLWWSSEGQKNLSKFSVHFGLVWLWHMIRQFRIHLFLKKVSSKYLCPLAALWEVCGHPQLPVLDPHFLASGDDKILLRLSQPNSYVDGVMHHGPHARIKTTRRWH